MGGPRGGRIGHQDPLAHVVAGYDPDVPVDFAVDVDFAVVVHVALEPRPAARDALPVNLGRNGDLDPVPGEGEPGGQALLDVHVVVPAGVVVVGQAGGGTGQLGDEALVGLAGHQAHGAAPARGAQGLQVIGVFQVKGNSCHFVPSLCGLVLNGLGADRRSLEVAVEELDGAGPGRIRSRLLEASGGEVHEGMVGPRVYMELVVNPQPR